MSVGFGRVAVSSTQQGSSCLGPGSTVAEDEGPDRWAGYFFLLGREEWRLETIGALEG